MARTARALGAVIVLAGLALATTGSAWAAFPGEDDQISFGLGTPTGDFQIATMRPDGSDVRVLARNPKNTFVFDSAWSADGRWIAFDRLTTNAGGSIWRVRRDGSHQQLVIAGSRSTGSLEPSWSPDGRWIVYA